MTQPIHKTDSKKLVTRLWRDYIRYHKRPLIAALLCMTLVAATAAVNAWMMQPVLDEIFLNKDATLLMIIPLVVAAVAIMGGVANYGQNICMRYIGQKIIATMQLDLFKHLVYFDLQLFHDQASGRLLSRFTNDIQMMRTATSSVLTGIAKEVLSFIFLTGVMIYQSWELSLIALLLFPTAILPILKLGRRMRKISSQVQGELGEFTARLDEVFQGIREVKAYNAQSAEIARANATIDRLFAHYFRASKVQVAASPMMEALGGIAIAAVIYYGGTQVVSGETTPGAFFSFITAMILAYKPIKSIAGLNNHLQEGLAAAARFFAMMDAVPTIQDKPDAKTLTLSKGEVRFDNVSFMYGGTRGTDGGGIADISLLLKPNTTTALVGPSGGGKSTVMNMLLRFYDIDSGAITIDGQDVSAVSLHSLRANIALVSQDITLFDATAFDNIAYGMTDVTQEQVEAAAKAAHAHSFIEELQEGYRTMLGPRGVSLSGGQRQRIAIARAILKNAPILLLDEATSALDNTSERLVQEALEKLMKGKTTLVIAHRLSTIRHASTIYVLKDGRVQESGDHASLLAQKGLYNKLYQTQFSEV